MTVASRASARACVVVLLIGLVGCSTAGSTPSPASIPAAASLAATPSAVPTATPVPGVTSAPGSTWVEWHGPSQPLVDRLTVLGYACDAPNPEADSLWCTYPGAGSVDMGEFGGVVPFGVGVQGRQDLQGVGMMTDDRERVGEVLEALTSAQTAAWAVDRLDLLRGYLAAWHSSGETADDGLPSCRTLDTAVVDLLVDFGGEVPILAVTLRPFDQPGSRPLPWMADQSNCRDQPILQSGASADSPCEEAVVAYLDTECCDEANHAAFEQLFTTCTRADFEGLNSKLTIDFREDWQDWVDGNCADADHPKTMLCQS